jgi:hypothetical protein
MQPRQAILYLSCCIPIHVFKLVTCYRRPWWAPLALLPVMQVHWCGLMASQAYFYTQCGATSLGCHYPGSIIMMVGEWRIP